MRGKHPNSQANLKPFEKGQSGNPSGRPKAFMGIKDDMHEYINSREFPNDDTHRQNIIERIVSMAEYGDKWAIELIEQIGCLD